MKLLKWLLMVVLMAPVTVLAEESDGPVVPAPPGMDRPMRPDRPMRRAPDGNRPGWLGRGEPGMSGIPQMPMLSQMEPSDEEWKEIEAFMKEYSPRRWEKFSEVPETGRFHRELRMMMTVRYRTLKRMEKDDPKLHELLTSRAKLEDTIFGLVDDIHTISTKAKDSGTPAIEPEAMKKQLKDEVGKLVDLGVQERQLRIEGLERQLKTERERVATDQKNRDAQVDERVQRLLQHGNRWGLRGGRPEDRGEGEMNSSPPGSSKQSPTNTHPPTTEPAVTK